MKGNRMSRNELGAPVAESIDRGLWEAAKLRAPQRRPKCIGQSSICGSPRGLFKRMLQRLHAIEAAYADGVAYALSTGGALQGADGVGVSRLLRMQKPEPTKVLCKDSEDSAPKKQSPSVLESL
ncbi:hypothetical protein cyc_01231 [Cyclospora cayetanensis]|uniref:Uncharacterized protein n=1 Tax=Cyclospora cayetanensis TaxID=88456 RepID=A0A1D3D1V7_9EIME|nr:hypothetical protein cyc_01231 [Cyclospora cayetanensis]